MWVMCRGKAEFIGIGRRETGCKDQLVLSRSFGQKGEHRKNWIDYGLFDTCCVAEVQYNSLTGAFLQTICDCEVLTH